jgi:HKD family nuclease
MAKTATKIGLRVQKPDSANYLYKRINELLGTEGLERFRIAVAYARWDGLGLFSQRLESFMSSGGEFQAIFGVGNGVTTPDALLYSLYLKELYTTHTYAGAVEDKYADSIFHPKMFEFRFGDRTILIVGSANLTGGGLLRNTELVAEIEVPSGDPAESLAEDAWKELKVASKAITLKHVRDLKKAAELADEKDKGGESKATKLKPRLPVKEPVAAKPLFADTRNRNGREQGRKPSWLSSSVAGGDAGDLFWGRRE